MVSFLPKTVLVTGGAGFIGSCFVRELLNKGIAVTVLDAFTYAGSLANLQNLKGPGKYRIVTGNICDLELVAKILREDQIDAVVNFAAESHVDRSITGPSEFIETNIRGTFVLLNASLSYWNENGRRPFRFQQISTDEVFGSLGVEGYFSEHTPLAPNSPYSASKASGDFLVGAWNHTYGLPTVITNCSNNYGPRQHPEKLIPHLILQSLANRPLPIYGDGLNVRDWIHVEDHCAGVFLALTRGHVGERYCFGGNAERTNLEVAKAICQILDQAKPRSDGRKYEENITFVKDRLGHDRRYAIDDNFAQQTLGFKRMYDFEKGLEATVHWYLDNDQWCQEILRGAK